VNVLSAISADLGTVTAGIAKSADGKLEINLANRTIKVWDNNGVLRVQLGGHYNGFWIESLWDASGGTVIDTTNRLPRLVHTQYISGSASSR